MAKGFNVKLDETAVKKTFVSLGRSMKDFTKPLEESAKEMLKVYSVDTFRKQGAAGEKWKRLSAATLLARKERTGHYKNNPTKVGKILIWTGRMQQGFRDKVSKVKLVISNGVPYFKFHQSGRGKTPQRRMLFINKDIITIVSDNVLKQVNKALRK